MKKKEPKEKKKESGFTMIELLLSLAIMAILTSASLTIARFADTQKNLTLSANQLRALIRSAQTYALAVPVSSDKHICGFGVYFLNSTTAQLFYTKVSDLEFEADAAACENYLKADVNLLNISNLEKIVLSVNSNKIGTASDIFFRVPYGNVYQDGDENGEITYTLTSGGATRDVEINSVGKVE